MEILEFTALIKALLCIKQPFHKKPNYWFGMAIICSLGLLFSSIAIGQTDDAELNYRFGHLRMQHGLSNNQVQCVLKDSRGFLWIGTVSGLNRYDGLRFKIYKRQPFDSLSLINNSVEELVEDTEGNIWVRTPSGFCIYNPIAEKFIRHKKFDLPKLSFSLQDIEFVYIDNVGNLWYNVSHVGLIKYNKETGEFFHIKYEPDILSNFSQSAITDIIQDNDNYYWIIQNNGCLEKIDNKDSTLIATCFLKEKYGQIDYDFQLFCDSDNHIWIFTTSVSYGVIQYKPEENEIIYWNKDHPVYKLNSNIIGSITQDNNNKIWIGTDHGGINIINKDNLSITYLLQDSENEKSIAQNSITCLYKDIDDVIWSGTFKQGLDYYHEKLFLFDLYTNIPSDPLSLNFNDVNCFVEDQKGNLFIGTNGGGLIYFNRKTESFSTIKHNPNDETSLSNNIVVSLCKDYTGLIWVGTYYGGLNVYDGNNFKTYFHNPTNPRSISDNRIWEIYEDSRKNLWIGTLGGGLDLYDRTHDVFHHYSGDDITSVQSKYVLAILEDSNGDLWVGTDNGVFIMEWKRGKVKHLYHSEADHKSLSNNVVSSLREDYKGTMWVGTRDGLNIYHKKDNSFLKLMTENGLPDNTIQTIVADDQHNMWISTSNGLSRITPLYDSLNTLIHFNFLNFDETDGLQDRSFNDGSGYKTSKGEIIFGGPKGFNMFQPSDFGNLNKKPPVYIVDFELLGEPIEIDNRYERKSILKNSIIHTDKLVLNYHENFFAIEFAALEFINSERIKYRYKLEGFNDNWLYSDYKDRKITFTNLDPGKYTFKVQTYQNIFDEETSEAQLSLVIKPPLWRSKVAIIIYILVLGLTLFLFRQFLVFKERLKFQNEQALLETQRQQELSSIKTRFFTNVSHEFRTPLTLIITPLERLLKADEKEDIQGTLKLVYQNAKRLLGLVNQLLDFRKMEEQRLKLNLEYANVIKFLEGVYKSFFDLAESKKIKFEFVTNIPELFMRFDGDKLEKIIFNLLSNAFKFTHEGDSITVKVDLIDKSSGENILHRQTDALRIQVIDTGIGIPKKKHERIFERFFQDEHPVTMVGKGSGIGLSLTKEFVKLHKGKIFVDSDVDRGSTFHVFLPVNRERIEKSSLIIQESQVVVPANNTEDQSKVTILLVEDNEDFRFYLRDNLHSKYSIAEASNGKEALQVVAENMPDLIVSDLKMPVMDGLQLCVKIKTDSKTSHIPFLLLTASHTEESKLEAFKYGADAYITKPFSFEILDSRIRNLISQREKTKIQYQKNFKIEPGTIGITPLDEKLMKKALSLVEENISDAEFTVEKLSSKLGFSRVHLYKKMLSITGKTPVEFIRLVRLKRAAQLLRESQLTVSEIAYQVGFNDPRYFSKQFRAEFNMLPSKFKDSNS